jgi:arsenate reductase
MDGKTTKGVVTMKKAPTVVYTYAKCSTCRRAVDWLESRGVAFEERPIRETPPSPSELKTMLGYYDGEIRRLFNTSGQDYREQNLSARLQTLSEKEAIALLSSNGNLVKRPFLLGDGFGVVGFDETRWTELFKE